MADEINNTPYDEASVAFPSNLSQIRYVSFNFYDSNFTSELQDVVIDLLAYSTKSIDNALYTDLSEGFSTTVSGASELASDLFGADNTFNEFAGKVKTRLAQNNPNQTDESFLNEATKKQFTKGFDARSAIENGTFKFAIYLPLVNGLREQTTQDWGKQNGIVANTLGQLMPKTVSGALTNIGNFFGARTLMTNPDWVQTYEGAGLRSFVMSWVLMPNSKEEAKTIFEIVRKFKRASSPDRAVGGTMLLPPLFCQIEFKNSILEDSVRMEEMVIAGIAINYSETGFMETYKDGVPKAIMLEVSVNERRMRTERDWKPRSEDESNLSGQQLVDIAGRG